MQPPVNGKTVITELLFVTAGPAVVVHHDDAKGGQLRLEILKGRDFSHRPEIHAEVQIGDTSTGHLGKCVRNYAPDQADEIHTLEVRHHALKTVGIIEIVGLGCRFIRGKLRPV